MQVRLKLAKNGEVHWTVKAANNRKIATGGETFKRRAGAAVSFSKLAVGIRNMTDAEFADFMAGLKVPLK